MEVNNPSGSTIHGVEISTPRLQAEYDQRSVGRLFGLDTVQAGIEESQMPIAVLQSKYLRCKSRLA